MDEERTTDDQQTGDTTQQEDRHGTPFGLESSIPGVGVHGAEDEHERAPSTTGSEQSTSEDGDSENGEEAPPLV